MSPINPPSTNESQRILDKRRDLDYKLSNSVDTKKIEYDDPVAKAYKNFSIEKEVTPVTTSLINGFKNFADLILKPLGFETFQESSVKKNNEKYFNAGDPNYLNERGPKQQETQPQDNKDQKPKEGFFVATFKSLFIFKPPVPKEAPIKNPDYNFNFERPTEVEFTEVNPVSKVVISNNRETPKEPGRFKEYRERSQIAGSEWRERVLATYPNEENSRDPNNSGVNASSKSSSGQESKPAELSTKTLQPPQSLAQIKPTKEELERLRDALLKERSQRLGQKEKTNSAPVPSEEKSKTLQAPPDRGIQKLALNTKRLQGLVLELQTSTESLKPQQNNVQEPKDELRESKTLIGAPLNAPPKETTTTATSSSTRASSTATSAVANNPEHSSPTTPPKVEGSEKEPLPKKERDTRAYDWIRNQRFPKLDPNRKVAALRPPIKSSTYRESEVNHPDHRAGFTIRNGDEIWDRMTKAQEAEKALAELEASKDQKKAPSRQTRVANKQGTTSPCGHTEGRQSFVAGLLTTGTGGGRGGRTH